MPKKTRRTAPLQSRQGREVIEEAVWLLRRMRFSAAHGAYAEGLYVAVGVDPRWNEEHETIQVLLTCYPFGHRPVDWAKLPVFVVPEERQEGPWVAFLSSRGQTVLPGLPSGAYRLSTSLWYGSSPGSGLFLGHSQALAAHPVDAAKLRDPQVYASSHGEVQATVRQTLLGTTAVAFETREAALAGMAVHFAFVPTSGKVEQSAHVALEPVEGEDALWEGRWEEVVVCHEPCTFVFELLPQDS